MSVSGSTVGLTVGKICDIFLSLDQGKYLFLISKMVRRKDMSHAVQLTSFLLRSPRSTFIHLVEIT